MRDYASIDRTLPAPGGRLTMRPGWHHLLFLHWTIPAEVLRPLLPSGLELDLFDGRAYIGLVPFTMTRVRPHWLPILPWRRYYEDFHEINVRTYVHHEGRNPGVWFFSLDAANSLAVQAARAWYKLPYFRAAMTLDEGDEQIHYTSRRLWPQPLPANCDITYRPAGLPAPATPGSLDHFLIERYFLYSYARGNLYRGRVHHTPYPVQSAEVSSFEENLLAASGIVRPLDSPLAHYASGVETEIYTLERL